MAQPAAILIVGPNWVGDMVMAEPLADWLGKVYGAAVDVLAPPVTAAVAARFPGVREAISLPFSPHRPELRARRVLASRLAGRYAAAYVLPGSWISALVPFLAGIPERVGYLREWRVGLLSRMVAMPRASRRHTAINHGRLGGFDGVGVPTLRVDTAQQARLLASHGLGAGGFVVLAPGSEGGVAKRWPTEAYAAVAASLVAGGERVVLLGAAGDSDAAGDIAGRVPDVLNLVGTTSIGEAIDLIAAARAVVANDSGLLHVAAAVGTRAIGIFGPTSPMETAPPGDGVERLWRQMPCSPCHQRTCPLGHHDCLRGIAPSDVMATLAAWRGTTR